MLDISRKNAFNLGLKQCSQNTVQYCTTPSIIFLQYMELDATIHTCAKELAAAADVGILA